MGRDWSTYMVKLPKNLIPLSVQSACRRVLFLSRSICQDNKQCVRGESIEVAVQSSLVKPAALRRSELLHRRVHRRRPGRIRSCWRSGWSGWISIWSISEEKMCFTWWMPTSLPLISLKGMARELFFAKPHSRLPDWKWYLFVRLLFRFPKFD